MKSEGKKVDGRSAIAIYDQTVAVAAALCPEWTGIQPAVAGEEAARDEVGIALLRAFSRLAETVVRQLDRAPEKHLLAFYDFIGTEQLSPEASRAALTFVLAKGTKDAVTVPARTRVAAKDDPKVVFETLAPLTAVNLQLDAAFSLDPWSDSYSDLSENISGRDSYYPLFVAQERVEHALVLSDDAFAGGELASLHISFSFTNAQEMKGRMGDLFGACADSAGTTLEPQVDEAQRSLFFEGITLTGGVIVLRPRMPLPPAHPPVLPTIGGLTCAVAAAGIAPDAVFFNDNSIELKKGFLPFGPTPKKGDTFYIACDRAFSKAGSTLSLKFRLKGGKASAALVIKWEYWNGSGWRGGDGPGWSGSGEATVFSAAGEGEVKLSLPADAAPQQADLNGRKGYWIRARIEDGGFGGPGGFKTRPSEEILSVIDHVLETKGVAGQTITEVHKDLAERNVLVSMSYVEPSYDPPFVYSMTVGYAYQQKPVQLYRTVNYFVEETPAFPFAPYRLLPQDSPAFYLGVEGGKPGAPCSLYFSLKPFQYGDLPDIMRAPGYEGADADDEVRRFSWRYFNGAGWADLGVDDGTVNFTRSGIVSFLLPGDLAEAEIFGRKKSWIKIVAGAGEWLASPGVRAILPNTVWAEHASLVQDEILGSSNGMPGQGFVLTGRPVLEGQIVEVKEPAEPSEDERTEIEREEGRGAVRVVTTEAGDIAEVWVRWHEVSSFARSGPLSRHYIIDRTGGRIVFGDGARGMIPPALPNNIAARLYKSGGGRSGDVGRNNLTEMKTTIPNVSHVFNEDPSSGGRDLERTDDLIRRTPYFLRTGDRAVTAGDFEMLAANASSYVAKASCVADPDSAEVVVIVAPAYADDAPVPEAALLDHVAAYLKERAFPPVREHIHVIGPSYTPIDVAVRFSPVSLAVASLAADLVEQKLRDFLHPIRGGREGEGWSFGSEVYHSEIASVIEDVEGVDFITTLTINGTEVGAPGASWVTVIPAGSLPRCGALSVTPEK